MNTYTEHQLDGIPCNVVVENAGSLLHLGQQVQAMLAEALDSHTQSSCT
jgi:hypothetical protein